MPAWSRAISAVSKTAVSHLSLSVKRVPTCGYRPGLTIAAVNPAAGEAIRRYSKASISRKSSRLPSHVR